jgi:hypothetical protein
MEKYQSSNATASIPISTGAAKGRPTLKSSSVKKIVESGDWTSRTEVVLELIQSKKRLTEKTKLIFPLFKLLKV